VTVAQTAQVSSWFEIPSWAKKAAVYIPAIDDGAVSLFVTIDDGTTEAPCLKADGSADAVIAASGTDPCFQDITDFIRALPENSEYGVKCRFKFGVAQNSAALTLYVYFKA
jgi:hypothetical protein